MTVSLSKGGNVSLSKEAPGLTSVSIGLGWDARTTTGTDFDLDASAIMVKADGKVVSDSHFVFFNNKPSPDGSVKFTGDNLTGEGEGDDESIKVNLATVPAEVDKIVFPVSIYEAEGRGQSFGQVRNAFIRIVNAAGGAEIARYDLSEDASTETAMIFGELYRNGAEWKFRAGGQGYAAGRTGIAGDYGVGHTRWATHGRPTEENAHPHRDCTGKIVVVHNGIIENYLDLKQELQAQGHKFVTETDTEIVAHLVERETKDDGLENAVRRALLLMRGLFALVLISADDPEKIVTVRNGPPIVVGLGDNEFFVASDIPAILSHTRDVVFLGDEEMAIITRTGVEFTDFFGRPVSKATQRVLWDPIMAEKAGYKHFMLKEIFEQPTAARETILGRVSQDSGKVFLEEMKITDAQFAAVEKVTILACGTSWHSALVGKYMIEKLARVPVEVDYGSEYRYRSPIVPNNTPAVVITQ